MAGEKILVVEDSRIIALELQERLQGLGYEVCGVTSYAEQAVEMTAAMMPDLVLMDIRLTGEMDGIEAAAEIRTRFDTPVVYLTAYADEGTLLRAKITEPYGYIVKPFEERELRTAIEIALYKHGIERRLRESERWFAATLTSIGDGVLATNELGWVAFMNPVAERLTGWSEKDARQEKVTEVLKLVHEQRPGLDQHPAMTALEEGVSVSLDGYVLQTRDGRRIPVDGNTALLKDDKGRVEGVVLVFRDISERRREEEEKERLQAQLFQAQKMEAVGALTGGIAHDINNLMQTIIGYSSLLLSKLEDEDLFMEGLTYIRQAGQRGTLLTKQLLALSHGQAPRPQLLDPNAIIAKMQNLLQGLAGRDIELVTELRPKSCCVKTDSIQLEQVIMNLVINAREAMPAGGRVTIRTGMVDLGEDECQHMPGARPGTYIHLSVSDTGVGMDLETRRKAFEPYFSTKEQGSGLGLSISASAVKQNGGWMEIESELGKGSTLHVYLPAMPRDLEAGEPEPVAAPVVQGRGERILLVEDEAGVRAATAEMLRAGNYEVAVTSTAREALEVFEAEEGAFQLVLSDVVLPDRSGLILAEGLLDRKAGLPILLTSGHTDERAQLTLIRERGLPFLRKPFDLAGLLSAVREALQEG